MNVSDEICTVAVYNLKMCMKEDGPGPKYFKGDKYLVQDGCILLRFDSQFSFIYPNCTVIFAKMLVSGHKKRILQAYYHWHSMSTLTQ